MSVESSNDVVELQSAERTARLAPITVPPHPRCNFTRPVGTFVGRERALLRFADALQKQRRLVTVTGFSGVGKTAFALHVTRLYLADYLEEGRGGLWLAALGEVDTTLGFLLGVARALGIQQSGAAAVDGLQALDEYTLSGLVRENLVGRGNSVLILDGVDRIAATVSPYVDAWLEASAGLCIVLTSSTRLGMSHEFVIELEGLSTPAEVGAEQSEALHFLIDRVENLDSRVVGTALDREQLADIVEYLDGVPSSMELVAGQIAFSGVASVHKRLSGDRSTELRDHVSGRFMASAEMSWDLLPGAERSALAQCAVFSGSFDLDAAEAVVRVAPESGRMLLHRLQQQSLLRKAAPIGDEKRLSMYRTLREFVRAKVATSAEYAAATERYVAYYVELGEALLRSLFTQRDALARRALERDRDNFLSAARSAVDLSMRLRALVVLEPVWQGGDTSDYEDLITEALSAVPVASVDAVRARLTRAAVGLRAGKLAESERDAVQSLQDARNLAVADLEARSEIALGMAKQAQGEFQEALEHLRAGLRLHESDQNEAECAQATTLVGQALAQLGDLRGAREYGMRAILLHQAAGNLRGVALANLQLGTLASDEDNAGEASGYLERAIELHQQLQDRVGTAAAKVALGRVFHRRGDLAEARAHYDEAASAFEQIGARRQLGLAVGYLGLLEREARRTKTARRHLERACSLVRASGDFRSEAYFSIAMAGVLGELSLEAEGEAWLERAGRTVVRRHQPDLESVLEAQRIVLDCAQAERATMEGDSDRCKTFFESARARTLRFLKKDARVQNTDETLANRPVLKLIQSKGLAPSTRSTSSAGVFAPTALVVAPLGAWFRLPHTDQTVSLAHRPVVGRVLLVLARARLSNPGVAMNWDDFARTVWPHEKPLDYVVRNRIRVIITGLRSLGLADCIQTCPTGYRLAERVDVVMAPASSPS